MEKFQNKYRIKSRRLQNWNYNSQAAYFITICTQNREHFFGEIINNKLKLSEIGKIVKKEWLKTFKIRSDMNLEMGEYIIMPNHFHAIIIIGKNKYNTKFGDFDIPYCIRRYAMHRNHCRYETHRVSTTVNININTTIDTITNQNRFGAQSKNLASVIRGFKSSVTTLLRKKGNMDFKWQSRFYDHIIRNEKSFISISNYIINNPKKWNKDRFQK